MEAGKQTGSTEIDFTENPLSFESGEEGTGKDNSPIFRMWTAVPILNTYCHLLSWTIGKAQVSVSGWKKSDQLMGQ